MLDLLNKIASMEFPRIQKQNEKLVRKYMAESRATPMDQQDLAEEIGIDDICKIAPNRETSLKYPLWPYLYTLAGEGFFHPKEHQCRNMNFTR